MNVNLRFLVLSLIFSSLCLTFWFKYGENGSAAANQTDDSLAKREAAYRANNIGVARLEQFSHKEAVEDFRQALALDPNLKIAQINLAIALFNAQDIDAALAAAQKAAESSPGSPQPVYLLGLIARNQNRTDEAEKYFERVLAADPQDVGTNVNLGQIYIQQRKYKEASELFRRALTAEPYNATAMYNLATALSRSSSREEGQQWMTRFQTLRQSGAATSIGLNYLEQGRYAEAVTSTGAESELVDKTAPKNVFEPAEIGLPVSSARAPAAPAGKDPLAALMTGAAVLFDLDNDGDLDLAQVSPALPQARLFLNQEGKFTDVTRSAADFNQPLPTEVFGLVAGDYDNDTLADLIVFGKGPTLLFRGNGKGGFQNVTATAKIAPSSAVSISGAFVDADHDGDLDIFLGGFGDGKNANEAAPNRLLRNNGDGTFTDYSAEAGINLPTRAVAVIPTDYDNRRDVDLLVANAGAAPYLFRNLRDGSFKNIAPEVGFDQISQNWTCVAAGDFNKDTYTDFFFGIANWGGIFAVSDGTGKFILKDGPAGTIDTRSAQFLDYDNDGLLDLVANTAKGFVVYRNQGNEWVKADALKTKNDDGALTDARQFLSGDIDSDGDIDLIAPGKNGSLQYLRNSGGANRSEVIRLQGRVSNRTGIGAKVDLRSGSLSQKLEMYSASPAPAPSQVHFGLGKRQSPDAVRVIWSSGVVQAETGFSERMSMRSGKNLLPFQIEELDRKPSSCPYLFTWNGEKFEFVTDFLGGGEMGNWKERGVYYFPDSDELVRITADQLKPKNGKYEIRVTNELEEVLFLDHLKLVAVEHDSGTEVYPNEGLGIPTAKERILYTTNNERPPLAAQSSDGKNVLPKIEQLDRVFYDDFVSEKIRGYAATHNLTLTLDDRKGFAGRTLLLLTGWTDYAFSSDNLAASQSGRTLSMPKLQVRNRQGEWETVIKSIGISVGRPQTVVVDLTGKFLSDSREVRIVTNFKTYWDRIAVDTSSQKEIKTVDLRPAQADLGTRGFSREVKYGEMITADYGEVLNDGRWKYFSGSFTRTGPVNPLLAAVDDIFLISKTGDELSLSFDALPAPPEGKKYTFLLYADGYSKEMDINSGSPDAVLPLPFKGMKTYPYGADEQYPMTEEKRRIYEEYTTRTRKGMLPRIEAILIR
jgi:Tfp pilus assembly protein PilF